MNEIDNPAALKPDDVEPLAARRGADFFTARSTTRVKAFP
tara:strand:- start:672 stop:791 length:120 start_codon:yes stop_codon:yes gene_type:complete